MKQFNIFRTSKEFFAKTIIISLCLLVNFSQASEITEITTKNVQSQDISAELPIVGEMQMYQFPNQQEYLVLCTMNQGKDSHKTYKGPLKCLTQLFEDGYLQQSIFKGQKCNHINIITTIGSFTNDNFYDEKAPDFPAWYDNLKDQYFSLTLYTPTDDVLNKIVWKDIDEETLGALGKEECHKELQLIGLNEEEASKKRLMLESSTSELNPNSDAVEENNCIIS